MAFPENPLVSIIIITCNRPFLLRKCIERVLAQPYANKEVIVVDSSSNDESEAVVADFATVRSLRLRDQKNNMPQARNTGIDCSTGDIVAFIDDDSMVQEAWLESLVSVYRDDTVGAAGGRIISMPEPYSEQFKGEPVLTVSNDGRVKAKGAGMVSHAIVEVDHLTGCNMSYRRAALEQVGGFDPNYTLTNLREETDLCVRVKHAGWRIVFVPSMAVVHFSPRSLQPYFLEKPGVQFSNGRNGSYFAIKNFGLTSQTLKGQVLDAGKACGRAAFFAGLFSVGALAQIAGRVVGIGAGLYWRRQHGDISSSSPLSSNQFRQKNESEPEKALQ